jgi:hypothetical protein
MEDVAKTLLATLKLSMHVEDESENEKFTAIEARIGHIHKWFMEESSRRPSGEEAGEYMENFVNLMSNRTNNDEFVKKVVYGTHRTLNQGLIGLFCQVFKEQAESYRKGQYDPRNEASSKFCSEIRPMIDNAYFPFI